jgi:hypothetical protein
MDFESISARISKCEEDIKILYSRTNKAEVNQARITEKLDNVLVELGRVRESIDSLKGKPANAGKVLSWQSSPRSQELLSHTYLNNGKIIYEQGKRHYRKHQQS